MAIDVESLLIQARLLPRAQRVQLIARLSAELVQDTPDDSKQPPPLDELLRSAKPWNGPDSPLKEEQDTEVTDFLRMRKVQREQDKQMEENAQLRRQELWDS